MEANQLPCDSIWLDIEYSHEKRYLTWNKNLFPNPQEMVNTLVAHQRKLVTIVDPHVKYDEDFFVYAEAKRRGILVQGPDSQVYHGQCWPKTSAWIDYLNPLSLDFVKLLYCHSHADKLKQITTLDDYIWHSGNVGIWIDMNEPACFEKTDKTMSKQLLHTVSLLTEGGTTEKKVVEHRDVHSLYGFYST